MKLINKLFVGLAMITAPICVNADNCSVHLMVAPMTQGENVPDEVNDMLMSRLEVAITASGVVASPDFDRFFVSGKINHLYKDVVAGPPMQHALHSTLTLYMGDVVGQKVYSTTTIELRGVGTSEQRAFVNAFRQLNAKNDKLVKFIEQGKRKIVDYYNKEYPKLMAQASQAEALQDYEMALSLLVIVPECCEGYSKVSKQIVATYNKYLNYVGRKLLAQAKAAWSASPDAYGAEKAYSFLNQIDPDAACYKEAEDLHKEIKKVVKENWDFENKQKYKDEIDLERRKIEAARAVGVAYGNGQKEQTTNLMWLR